MGKSTHFTGQFPLLYNWHRSQRMYRYFVFLLYLYSQSYLNDELLMFNVERER